MAKRPPGRKNWKVNDYILENDYAVLILTNGKGEETARSKVDLDKLPNLLTRKWCVNWEIDGTGRVCTRSPSQYIVHFLIPDRRGLLVDHINGDTLDNRLCNLRLATPKQNSHNRNYKGYYFRKDRGTWRACICVDGKILSRAFKNETDAALWRAEMNKKYHGEFVRPICETD